MKKQEYNLFRWREELDEIEHEKELIYGGDYPAEEVIWPNASRRPLLVWWSWISRQSRGV